jgi:membrane protease YdiL (CAAX protease family)
MLTRLLRLLAKPAEETPASLSLAPSMFLFGVIILSPTILPLPIGNLPGLLLVGYFLFNVPRLSDIGLAWPLPRPARKAMLVTGIIFVLLISVAVLSSVAVKSHILPEPEIGPHQLVQSPKPTAFAHLDEKRMAPAFADRDFRNVAKLMASSFVSAIIMAPIVETFFLLAVFFPALWKRFGYISAVSITVTVFALAHFFQTSKIGLLIIAFSAYIQLILFLKTKSLYPAIFFHLLWNFTMTVFYITYNWGLPA